MLLGLRASLTFSPLNMSTNQDQEEKMYFHKLRLLSPYFITDVIVLVSLFFSVIKFQISLRKIILDIRDMPPMTV